MAWVSLGNVVVVFMLLLSPVPVSCQGCPQGGVYPESIEEGPTSKGHVLASYGDGVVTNLTVKDDALGYLAVNASEDSGGTNFTLYITKEINLETLQRDSLEGSVVCSDGFVPTGYSPSDVLITITAVNEFPPQFVDAPYSQNLTEDSAIGSTVFRLDGRATDGDYPPATLILYGIVNSGSPFAMDSGHTVLLQNQVDYETGPSNYVLNISAYEGGTTSPLTSYTTLTIYVTDTDDLGPRFNHNATYTLALPEGEYHDDVFNTEPAISAHDGDSLNDEVQLQLDLTSQAVADRFSVLTNGSIQVRGTLKPGQVTFNVRVFQTNRPSDRFAVTSVTVTVYDVNDHSPVMSSATYSGQVQESAVSGTVVLTVFASDEDKGVNSSFQFHLNDSNVPFSISTEGTVGILHVNGSLDRETQQSYLLHVYAQEDQTSEKWRSDVSSVTVTLLDVNDNSPEFHGKPYEFNVTETGLEGNFVGQVNATDADSGSNGDVTFSITADSSQGANAFSVDRSTGDITLARNLTQQDIGVVFLDVKADDSATPQQLRRSTSTRVKVSVAAVNLHVPVFSPELYTFTEKETVQIGVSLGVIRATDQDNDHLTYRLINSSHDFHLEGDPPSLLVNASLDLDVEEALREHTFGVVASDGEFESTATVTVRVTTVNEYPPEFGQAVYFASVKENDTLVNDFLTIQATDRDRGADGEVQYNITSPSEGDRGPFVLNASTGGLSLLCGQADCLDYDVKRQYTLVVGTADGGNPAKSAYCTVIVDVMDVNNQAPVFNAVNFTGTVSEDAELSTTVLRLQATDEDTPSSELVYGLHNVLPLGWLTLREDYVITNGSLDAETAQYISAIVTVSDGVQQDTAFLNVAVLDVNDNYPQISLRPSSTVDIPENTTVGSLVVTVDAHDDDVTQGGSFLFYFDTSPSGKFVINTSSGDITVAAPFDRRTKKDYEVTVSVSDNSAPPKMNSTTLYVVISDSNSAPVFVDSANSSVSSYSFNVSEEEIVGSVIGFVRALDPDSGSSGQVHYSIERGNEDGAFVLDDSTGQLSVRQELDHEEKASYSLTIVATDNSYEPKSATAVVTVTVADVVEAPQWPESMPTVHLTSNKLCEDVQVHARPQDILHASSSSPAAVVYSLLNHTDLFLINNETGLLQRKGTLPPGTYILGLRACSVLDETVCSDAPLTIVVSADEGITFCPPFLTVNVNESEAIDHVVVDMNSTDGDRNITYSLTDESHLPFRINQLTGVITVQEALDRESTPRYTLEILALYHPTEVTATAQVTVVVEDAPDWPPRFLLKRYDGEISEAAHVGDRVLTDPAGFTLVVSAEDKDLDPVLTYSVISSEDNSMGAFGVNSSTGEVTLQRIIDRENMAADQNAQYTLTVLVTDGYSTDNATIIISVLNDNDNSPVFDPNILIFNVSEGQHPPFDVARLEAKDLDVGDTENLLYSLVSSDEAPFVVSPLGFLQLTKKLDREKVASYNFTVVATDPGGRNGTAQININIIDANEAPYFENSTYKFHVIEGADGLTFQQNLTAVDEDLGDNAVLNFRIHSGDDRGAFKISTSDHVTGVLALVNELDREETPSLTLRIIAVDSGQPSLTATCTVELEVVDVNDNDPVWTEERFTAVVSEGAANNTMLSFMPELSVSDEDEGLHGREGMVFRLEPSFPAVPFRADRATGNVYVALFNASDQLDREISVSYTLTLVATDEEGQGRNASTSLTITLSNVNDHSPVFSQPHYSFSVSEDAPVGQLVATLNATDRDNQDDNSNGTANGLLRFFLSSPGGQGRFYLDPVSGELLVSGPLDRETRDHYVLELGVYDGLLWGKATANVTVDDVNDNCPVFEEREPLALRVTENEAPGIIYIFNVTDDDAGSNGDVTLYTNDTNAGLYLNLTGDGTLSTKQRLDREKDDQQSLTFTVSARDWGTPPCVTSLLVRLEVLGDNEDPPAVCQITREQNPVCGQNISVTAFDGDSEGTFLAALTWSDSDEGEGGQATLSLDQDDEHLFTLNQSSTSTSLLTLAKGLDKAELSDRGKLGDNNATYTAVVKAEDGGGAQSRSSSVLLVLTVLERSPTMPAFPVSFYNFSVLENQPPTVIGSVKATTQSGAGLTMNYGLQSTADFTIDSMGNISTIRKLNREREEQYTFLVLAWETSEPSETASAVVLVHVGDENDHSPRFSDGPTYKVSVLENRRDVELVTFVATDEDGGGNGAVTFTLVNSSFDGTFTVNSTSGVLWLNQSLDRETKSSYTLHVEARDGGSPARSSRVMVNVTVMDDNDNAPTFSKPVYLAYLDENAPAATLVKNVTATDLDSGLNGQVLYHLESDGESPHSPSALFFINQFSGAIYTARSLHVNTEQIFNLTVKAQDLGSQPKEALATVHVYVNDLSTVLPVVRLNPETVALVLGTPAGMVVPVNVSGGFGTYNFSIVGGNEDGLFAMDPDNGQLTVTTELTETAVYQLVIRVVNLEAPQYYSDGTLTVVVTTVKLEQERYAAVLPENQPAPYLLLDVNSNAERAGIPVVYRLQGQGNEGLFTIGTSTGQLMAVKSLDREERSEYIMTVSVNLAHKVSTGRRKRALGNEAEIRVIVDDVNDNPPQFDVMSNMFGIPSSAPANFIVTTLQAKDPDAGTSGDIVYSVTGGDTRVFYVSADGKVTSLVAMTDQQSGDRFSLSVNATDNQGVCGGTPGSADSKCQTTKIDLKIVVVPYSDRFGLVANITVGGFYQRQQFYIRNLSAILNMTLQSDKVEPHKATQAVDPSKSDIYFYAFDHEGNSIPYTTINERVEANADAIRALFRVSSVQLIPVTPAPTRVRVETRSAMGGAEIAVIVVASLIFLGSLVAICLTVRAWKKQKEFQQREEAAVRARQKLEQEARDLADKMQETSFVTDPEEPLELDMDPEDEGRVFNPRMFLKNMRESEYRPAPVDKIVATEVQECVMNFENERTGVDTVTLRREVLRRTQAVELEAILKEEPNCPDSNEVDSGTENHNDSLSSEERSESGSGRKTSAPTQEESGQSSSGKAPAPISPHVSSGSSSLAISANTGDTIQNTEDTPSVIDNSLAVFAKVPKTVMNGNVMSENKAAHSPNENVSAQVNKDVVIDSKADKDHNENVSLVNASGKSMDITPKKQSESTDKANTETTAEDKDDEPEEPPPDYQKRVSFANILDAQNDVKDVKEDAEDRAAGAPNPGSSVSTSDTKKIANGQVNDLQTNQKALIQSGTNYLDATSKLLDSLRSKKSAAIGVLNPVYLEDTAVLDGWAEDYDSKAKCLPTMSTAL